MQSYNHVNITHSTKCYKYIYSFTAALFKFKLRPGIPLNNVGFLNYFLIVLILYSNYVGCGNIKTEERNDIALKNYATKRTFFR